MSSRKLKFALFGNIYQEKKSASIQKLLSYLHEHDADVYIDNSYYQFLTFGQHLRVEPKGLIEGRDFNVDFAISMGGDGTFLKTASRVGNKGIPILGINMGRLGFLADIGPCDIERAFDDLYEGKYEIEERSVIKVDTDGEPFEGFPYALNDVAVLKRDSASMISVHAHINGKYVTTFQADGLVVSTPTGSTAYSLSVGGPILYPHTHTMLMTAVAPHSLNIRPIVVSDDCVIQLTVESRSHNFLVGIDGRSEKCKEGTKLTLSKAPYTVKVIKHRGETFFNTLREKMMWGADVRR